MGGPYVLDPSDCCCNTGVTGCCDWTLLTGVWVSFEDITWTRTEAGEEYCETDECSLLQSKFLVPLEKEVDSEWPFAPQHECEWLLHGSTISGISGMCDHWGGQVSVWICCSGSGDDGNFWYNLSTVVYFTEPQGYWEVSAANISCITDEYDLPYVDQSFVILCDPNKEFDANISWP